MDKRVSAKVASVLAGLCGVTGFVTLCCTVGVDPELPVRVWLFDTVVVASLGFLLIGAAVWMQSKSEELRRESQGRGIHISD